MEKPVCSFIPRHPVQTYVRIRDNLSHLLPFRSNVTRQGDRRMMPRGSLLTALRPSRGKRRERTCAGQGLTQRQKRP